MLKQTITIEEIDALLAKAAEQTRPPEVSERLQWFRTFAEHKSVAKVCETFGIARSTYYRWTQRFDPSDLSSLEDQPSIPASFPYGEQGTEPAVQESGQHKGEVVYKVPTVMRYTLMCFAVGLLLNASASVMSVVQNSQMNASLLADEPVYEEQLGSGTQIDLSAFNLQLSDCLQNEAGQWKCTALFSQ